MSVPLLQAHLLGLKVYIARFGATVDAQTIALAVKPDNAPTTNWTDNPLGTVLNFSYFKEEVDLSYMAPLATGGKTKINRKMTVQDGILLETEEMHALVHELRDGLTAAIVDGTAQTPGEQLDRKVEAWVRMEGINLDGAFFVREMACEIRLENDAKFEDKVVPAALRLTQLKTSLNTTTYNGS